MAEDKVPVACTDSELKDLADDDFAGLLNAAYQSQYRNRLSRSDSGTQLSERAKQILMSLQQEAAQKADDETATRPFPEMENACNNNECASANTSKCRKLEKSASHEGYAAPVIGSPYKYYNGNEIAVDATLNLPLGSECYITRNENVPLLERCLRNPAIQHSSTILPTSHLRQLSGGQSFGARSAAPDVRIDMPTPDQEVDPTLIPFIDAENERHNNLEECGGFGKGTTPTQRLPSVNSIMHTTASINNQAKGSYGLPDNVIVMQSPLRLYTATTPPEELREASQMKNWSSHQNDDEYLTAADRRDDNRNKRNRNKKRQEYCLYNDQPASTGLEGAGGPREFVIDQGNRQFFFNPASGGRSSPPDSVFAPTMTPQGQSPQRPGKGSKRKRSDGEKAVKSAIQSDKIYGFRGHQSLDSLLEYIEGTPDARTGGGLAATGNGAAVASEASGTVLGKKPKKHGKDVRKTSKQAGDAVYGLKDGSEQRTSDDVFDNDDDDLNDPEVARLTRQTSGNTGADSSSGGDSSQSPSLSSGTDERTVLKRSSSAAEAENVRSERAEQNRRSLDVTCLSSDDTCSDQGSARAGSDNGAYAAAAITILSPHSNTKDVSEPYLSLFQDTMSKEQVVGVLGTSLGSTQGDAEFIPVTSRKQKKRDHYSHVPSHEQHYEDRRSRGFDHYYSAQPRSVTPPPGERNYERHPRKDQRQRRNSADWKEYPKYGGDDAPARPSENIVSPIQGGSDTGTSARESPAKEASQQPATGDAADAGTHATSARPTYASIARHQQRRPHSPPHLGDYVADAIQQQGGNSRSSRQATSLHASPRSTSPAFSASTTNQVNASSPDLKMYTGEFAKLRGSRKPEEVSSPPLGEAVSTAPPVVVTSSGKTYASAIVSSADKRPTAVVKPLLSETEQPSQKSHPSLAASEANDDVESAVMTNPGDVVASTCASSAAAVTAPVTTSEIPELVTCCVVSTVPTSTPSQVTAASTNTDASTSVLPQNATMPKSTVTVSSKSDLCRSASSVSDGSVKRLCPCVAPGSKAVEFLDQRSKLYERAPAGLVDLSFGFDFDDDIAKLTCVSSTTDTSIEQSTLPTSVDTSANQQIRPTVSAAAAVGGEIDVMKQQDMPPTFPQAKGSTTSKSSPPLVITKSASYAGPSKSSTSLSRSKDATAEGERGTKMLQSMVNFVGKAWNDFAKDDAAVTYKAIAEEK